jgi:hypothetical protein
MANINIPVDADLAELLKVPSCIDLSLPKPKKLKITLPSGGTLNAFTDLSKGVPTDCSLTFSLMLQLAPLLASMDCLLKILALLGPLVEIVKGLPFPPVSAVKKFIKAATDLAPCLAIPSGAPLIPFVRDILCLIAALLRCFVGQLKTIRKLMAGLSLQIQAAQDSGNTQLMATLECAQQNAQASASGTMSALEPVFALLSLVSPVMQMAGAPALSVSAPALGSQADVAALDTLVTTLQSITDAVSTAAEALGGCE